MITSITRLSPIYQSILLLITIGLILLMPTDVVFSRVLNNDFTIEYINLAFKMSIIFILSYTLIRSLKIKILAGLTNRFPWRFKLLNFIPAYLFVLGILSISTLDLSLIIPSNVILLLCACLMVGFAEEFLFRGLLLSLFLKNYATHPHGIFKSILYSSLFFGAFHLFNLTTNDNTPQVLIQVIFASFIGFFFGALLIKTNKLIPIAITHGLINFFFSLVFLPGLTKDAIEPNDTTIAPIIIALPLLVTANYIYKHIDTSETISKLNLSTTEL